MHDLFHSYLNKDRYPKKKITWVTYSIQGHLLPYQQGRSLCGKHTIRYMPKETNHFIKSLPMFKRLYRNIKKTTPSSNPNLTLFSSPSISSYSIFKYKVKQNIKVMGFLFASFATYKAYSLFVNHEDVNIPLYCTYNDKLFRNIILQDLLDNDINLFYIDNLIKGKLLKVMDNDAIKFTNDKLSADSVKIKNDNNFELFMPIKYLTLSYKGKLSISYNIILTINPFKVIGKLASSLSKDKLNTAEELLLMTDNASGQTDGSHHLQNNIRHYQLLIKSTYTTNQNSCIEFQALIDNYHNITFNKVILAYTDKNGNCVRQTLV